MKCNHSRPGFELELPCPFPATGTYIYIYILDRVLIDANELMALYSPFHAPELEPHHQMQFSVIHRTPHFGGGLNPKRGILSAYSKTHRQVSIV